MENLILIGGIPGTGKTTLAYELAIKNKIDKVVSIDTIKAAEIGRASCRERVFRAV